MTMAFNEKTFVPDKNTNWNVISRCEELSEKFIEKFKNEVDWPCISIYQKLSEEFIISNNSYVSFGHLVMNSYLSMEFKKDMNKISCDYYTTGCHDTINDYFDFLLKIKDRIKDIKMWDSVPLEDYDDYYGFLEKIEDRIYGAI